MTEDDIANLLDGYVREYASNELPPGTPAYERYVEREKSDWYDEFARAAEDKGTTIDEIVADFLTKYDIPVFDESIPQ